MKVWISYEGYDFYRVHMEEPKFNEFWREWCSKSSVDICLEWAKYISGGDLPGSKQLLELNVKPGTLWEAV